MFYVNDDQKKVYTTSEQYVQKFVTLLVYNNIQSYFSMLLTFFSNHQNIVIDVFISDIQNDCGNSDIYDWWSIIKGTRLLLKTQQ